MSYYDDWIAPYMFDCEAVVARQQEIEDNRHIGWTTREGELIPYHKISTSHLINCKKFIERNDFRKSFLPYIITELKRRGINEQDCI